MRATGDRSYHGKRFFDLTVLVLVAPAAALAAAVCALAVKLDSPGPVLFRQQRVGLGGRTFEVCKFRTMVHATDNPVFPEASRVTRSGRWLRRLSLDELPQLLNVLVGDMSVVGPRPTLPYQVARYDERQRRRLLVRPGVTGLAQVRGRNGIAWATRIEHDLEYVDRQSPLLDLRILVRTIYAVLGGSGVAGHPEDDPLSAPPQAGAAE